MLLVKLVISIIISLLVTCPKYVLADHAAGADAMIKKDYAVAKKEFEASNNDRSSQSFLGLIYLAGLGVPQDYKLAAYWYEKAAKQGDPTAQYRFAVMLLKGQGVEQNLSESFAMFNKAAEFGLIDAMYYMGQFYLQGKVVPVDNIQAYKWMNLVSSYQDIDITHSWIEAAAKDKIALEKIMTNEEIDKAQQLSTEWHVAKSKRDEVEMKHLLDLASKIKKKK